MDCQLPRPAIFIRPKRQTHIFLQDRNRDKEQYKTRDDHDQIKWGLLESAEEALCANDIDAQQIGNPTDPR